MTDKIYIQIGDDKFEAKGADLDYILETQAQSKEQSLLAEQERQAKQAARQSALAKLAALGLTEAEIAAL
jgi:DNA-binding NarL/FixJ family response regulator